MSKLTAGRRICNGVVIAPNQFSAAWRRKWWIVDIGRHNAKVREALIREAGQDPDDFSGWCPTVSFPSLTAACAAIQRATGEQA